MTARGQDRHATDPTQRLAYAPPKLALRASVIAIVDSCSRRNPQTHRRHPTRFGAVGLALSTTVPRRTSPAPRRTRRRGAWGFFALTRANRAPYHHRARREYLVNIVEVFGLVTARSVSTCSSMRGLQRTTSRMRFAHHGNLMRLASRSPRV